MVKGISTGAALYRRPAQFSLDVFNSFFTDFLQQELWLETPNPGHSAPLRY